jgi:predicted RecA/RadA family phage recombinase
MAKNYIQRGDVLTIPAPATVTSGGVVIAGGIIGVAAGDAASGAPVDVETRGVFSLPKVGANAFTLGATVYWDESADLATVTSAGNTAIGVAVAAAGSGAAAVHVKLG